MAGLYMRHAISPNSAWPVTSRHASWRSVSLISQHAHRQLGSNSTWLDSTRLDTFDFVEPVEQVETLSLIHI